MEKCSHCDKFCHKLYLHNSGPACGVFGRILRVGEQRPESRLLIHASPHTCMMITNFSPFSVLLCPYLEPNPATAIAGSFPQVDWDPLCTHLGFVCMKFPVILGLFLVGKKRQPNSLCLTGIQKNGALTRSILLLLLMLILMIILLVLHFPITL